MCVLTTVCVPHSIATIISFNMKSLVVDEGVGVVNETVFLEIQGMAEPALVVNVELSSPSELVWGQLCPRDTYR